MSDIKEFAKTFQLKIELDTKIEKMLLAKLGNPQKDINLIHVTGTNGKGSVCAFLESMLVSSGASVGRYSSPELTDKTEVIRLNGKNIDECEFDLLIDSIKDAVCEVEKQTQKQVSQFEILTACAFLYFKKKKPDYVIMEVGMGGTGDATNVCDSTKLALITKISMDHSAYLGDSTREIAKVKCGIIKEGCTVVTTEQNRFAQDIIENEARAKNARVIWTDSFENCGFEDVYEITKVDKEKVKLSLGGLNQLENSSIAVCAAHELNISKEHIIYGLSHAVNPARFEKLKDNFYFDGAHNVDGAQSLKKNISRYFKGQKTVFIMAMMKDKDISAVIDSLNAENAMFKFVTASVRERAASAYELLKIAKEKNVCAQAYESASEAVNSAKEVLKKDGGVAVICGSLYFYKDIIEIFS